MRLRRTFDCPHGRRSNKPPAGRATGQSQNSIDSTGRESAELDRELVPVGQDLFGLFHFSLGAGEIESQFSCSPSDLNFDGGEAGPLHAQQELFMGFLDPVVLETVHG